MEGKPLLESALSIGTLVQWRAGKSSEVGVVVGTEGRDVLAVSTYDSSLDNTASTKMYRDEKLTQLLPQGSNSLFRQDVHRIPRQMLQVQGKVQGTEQRSYRNLARKLRVLRLKRGIKEELLRLAGVS